MHNLGEGSFYTRMKISMKHNDHLLRTRVSSFLNVRRRNENKYHAVPPEHCDIFQHRAVKIRWRDSWTILDSLSEAWRDVRARSAFAEERSRRKGVSCLPKSTPHHSCISASIETSEKIDYEFIAFESDIFKRLLLIHSERSFFSFYNVIQRILWLQVVPKNTQLVTFTIVPKVV